MKTNRLILGFALVALAVGYIELRLPPPVAAQGRDAVYERLAVTGALKSGSLAVTNAASIGGTATASALAVTNNATVSGTATVGVLKFGTALTSTMTARLAASGTASDSTYLRGDGNWQNPLEAFRGQIAAFNGPCPTDWNELTVLRGRFIVGLVDGGTLAGTRGTALTDLEIRRGGTLHPAPYFTYSGNSTHQSVQVEAFQSAGTKFRTTTSVQDSGIRLANSTAHSRSLNQKLPAPYVQLRYCEYQP